MRNSQFLFLSALCLFLCAAGVRANIFVVQNANDAGSGSLRQAVDSANQTAEADDIVFEPVFFSTARTVTLTSGEIVITRPLNILGTGQALLSISGNHASRIFFLRNTATVNVSGLTIRDGRAPSGGGNGFAHHGGCTYIEGGQLNVSKVTVTGCRAEQGGGIFMHEAMLRIVDSTISNNQASGGRNDGSYGGGIFSWGTIVVANSAVTNNVAKGADFLQSGTAVGSGVGGGINHYQDVLTITNSLIASNSSQGGSRPDSGFAGSASGGGLAISGPGVLSVSITNSLIHNNHAVAGTSSSPGFAGRASGGGILALAQTDLYNVTVSSNSISTTNHGGGISGGGGLWNACTSCLAVTNSTIVDNTAAIRGGGVHAYSSFQLKNSIIAGNSSPFGPDIYNGVASSGNNLVGDGSSTYLVHGLNNDQVGTTAAPIDPLLGPLADNGGFTQTRMPLAGSPAIDRGNNCVVHTSGRGCLSVPLITDQRGFFRQAVGPVDIGAVEAASTNFMPAAPGLPHLLETRDAGISNTDNLTSWRALAFSVSNVPSQATVQLLRQGMVVTSAYSASGGSMTLYDAPPAGGIYEYTSRVIVTGSTSAQTAPLVVTFDITAPEVTIDQAPGQTDPTDVQPVSFLARFSEPVFGMAAGSVSLVGSTANTGTANITVQPAGTDGRDYLITVAGLLSTGTIRATIPGATVSDLAGNLNSASTSTDNTVLFRLVTPTPTPTPTPVPAGFEGDLAPRFSGDEQLRSNDVEVARMFVAGEPTNQAFNEFQRVDVAPYETRGDGRVDAADFQLIKNYVATLVAPQAAGGPTQPLPLQSEGERFIDKRGGRALGVTSSYAVAGGKAAVSVEFEPLGDERAVLFSLVYDASVLANPAVSLNSDVPAGTVLTVNSSSDSEGIIRVLVDTSHPLTKGLRVGLVNISFDVAKDAPVCPSAISFAESGSMADADSRSIKAEYVDGTVIVLPRSVEIPAPGDFDGDSKADLSVLRPSDGQWHRTNSGNGSFFAFPFGTNGDMPTQSAFQ